MSDDVTLKEYVDQRFGDNDKAVQAAGYFYIHLRLKKQFGNPKSCEQCGKIGGRNKGGKWDIHWAKLKGKEYEHKRENFWGLCAKCHAAYDNNCPAGWNKGIPNSGFKRGYTPWNKGARKSHCPQGHPYKGDNLIITPTGQKCRKCQNKYVTNWMRKQKELQRK